MGGVDMLIKFAYFLNLCVCCCVMTMQFSTPIKQLNGIVLQVTESRYFIPVMNYMMGCSWCVHTYHIFYKKLNHNNHVPNSERNIFGHTYMYLLYSRVDTVKHLIEPIWLITAID